MNRAGSSTSGGLRPDAYPIPMPTALVIRTAGTNCDAELARAFELAGAQTRLAHLEALVTDPSPIDKADLIGFPGGFSYGDDVASGRIFAMHTRLGLMDSLRGAIDRGACIIGICNGFQVLVQTGLLPGIEEKRVALTVNSGGSFISDWCGIAFEGSSKCVWTRGLAEEAEETNVLPIAHGEGCFVADGATAKLLGQNGQVALRYRDDVNGSVDRIAGICDPTGRVFGLMPHPERYLEWNRHPSWTRLTAQTKSREPIGLLMFKNAVEAVSSVGAR